MPVVEKRNFSKTIQQNHKKFGGNMVRTCLDLYKSAYTYFICTHLVENGNLCGTKLLVELLNLIRRTSDEGGASVNNGVATSTAVRRALVSDLNTEGGGGVTAFKYSFKSI